MRRLRAFHGIGGGSFAGLRCGGVLGLGCSGGLLARGCLLKVDSFRIGYGGSSD
jgi:hypothetical protein